jgi:hypothetical protein
VHLPDAGLARHRDLWVTGPGVSAAAPVGLGVGNWCGRYGQRVCFSAQADVVGGAVVAVIGFDAARHVNQQRDHLAFAALPLLLAAHELDEALVWWGLQGHVPAGLGHVAARLGDYHVDYGIHLHAGLVIVTAYVFATCDAAILSGYRRVAIFGVVNLIAVAALARLVIDGFASLWCAWAALTSVGIALHLRFGTEHRTVARALS